MSVLDRRTRLLLGLVLGLVLALAASPSTRTLAEARSMQFGYRRHGDDLVCVGYVDLVGRYNQVVSAGRVCNSPRWNQIITYVLALDRGYGGRGGYAEITKGGPGYRNVTLHLWSQRGQPLNFTLNVYAKTYW